MTRNPHLGRASQGGGDDAHPIFGGGGRVLRDLYTTQYHLVFGTLQPVASIYRCTAPHTCTSESYLYNTQSTHTKISFIQIELTWMSAAIYNYPL